ncbi:MAG TPA: DUF1236 domain-containing protein [Xanthobacteraceae bacterium]
MALALALCCIGASALAQTPALQPTLPAPKLNLTLEQRHVIRELIKDVKPQSSGDLHPAVGDTVPQNVDLKPMPGEVAEKVPQVKSHRFFIAGGEIVIVDPKDSKVADVIKLASD